ncbi:tyrosinase family oxidase copper chaperone [Streptomyces sp. Go-475]|uniref:tyrosinase family oxidase copper chaperone n=1 Tax=Streptomyces sp. Go-475 TaxID=2072505 RepID=UPI000DEFAF3B|nr:tyrosinase family oxidase copper chaperone [Streptomyces sp. Go-475]AXE85990.1 Tyrosinase co-factor MelC1 [Streptomyces sp. Go-475]
MVVGVGGVPVGAAGDGGAAGTRRGVLRGLAAAAAGAVLAPVAVAAWPEESDGKNTAVRAGDGMFEETYRGRLIRGVPIPSPEQEVGDVDWHVTVDGRPLHLMRRADGSWLSMVDHYRSYPTPLAATRAAVDEMGPGQRLRDLPGHGPGHQDGGAHGVHA